MNTTKLLALAKFIEANEQIEFNMLRHETCAMGFLAIMEGEQPGIDCNSTWAAKVLEISNVQASTMFLLPNWWVFPHGDQRELSSITRDQMVRGLRGLAKNGLPATRRNIDEWRIASGLHGYFTVGITP